MQFKIIAAQDLDRNQRHQIAELCFSAFDEDPWSQYAFMQKAIHVVGILNNQIISHALWTDRVFTINGSSDVKTAGACITIIKIFSRHINSSGIWACCITTRR